MRVYLQTQATISPQPKKNTKKQLTHPKVIKLLSSVNCMTNSSSSIVHVSLVACCFGINSVVTEYLCPLSFPNNNPHVSLFASVFKLAIARNRGRHSRGRLTFLRLFAGSDSGRLGRDSVGGGGGGGGAEGGGADGTGGAGREGPW